MEYLLKISGVIILFYVCYALFLERETFFQSNRWYLLTGLLASLSIPMIVIPKYVVKQIPVELMYDSAMTVQGVSNEVANPISWLMILTWIYVLGVILFSGSFLIRIASLINLIVKGDIVKGEECTFVRTKQDVSPFSVFNYVVFNPEHFDENELRQIITHEKVHVMQKHSVDIFLAHLMIILNWFNPVVWMYKNRLEQNLEFIADYEAQQQLSCNKSYQHLLLKSTVPNYKMVLANNFYNSLIKKRIVMLHKTRSNKFNQIKMFLILPLLGIFLMSFNTKEIVTYENPEETIVTGSFVSEAEPKTDGDVEMIMITKDTSDDELKDISKKMADKGITLKFKGVKRNSNDEITAISITAKTKNSNASYSESDDDAIDPIKIVIKDGKSISIGNGKDTGHRDYTYTISGDGEVHEVHTVKGNRVFVHSDDDDEHEVHEIIEDDGKMIIKKGNKITEIKKHGKGNAFFISDDEDGDHEVIEIIEGEDGDTKKIVIKDGKKIVVKRDEDGNIVKEWIEKDGNNIWISSDEDEDNIFTVKSKGKNKLFISSGSGEEPLYILDGKEVSKEVIDEMDTDDIESINVLKGDSAAKKYGEKGKNGVVVIKSKN